MVISNRKSSLGSFSSVIGKSLVDCRKGLIQLVALFSSVELVYLQTHPMCSHRTVPNNCWAIDFLDQAKQESTKGSLKLFEKILELLIG